MENICNLSTWEAEVVISRCQGPPPTHMHCAFYNNKKNKNKKNKKQTNQKKKKLKTMQPSNKRKQIRQRKHNHIP